MQRIKSLSDYFKKYELSEKDPESFWSEIAESFTWKKKSPTPCLHYTPPNKYITKSLACPHHRRESAWE